MRRIEPLAVAAALLAASAAASCSSGTRPAADLLVRNARVFTVDAARPWAEAVAVLGDRIVAVGDETAVGAWQGPSTRVLDAGGRLVLPGFNDAHVHFVQGGLQLERVHLKDAATPDELARRIGEKARSLAPGEWILGGDWDEQLWDPPALPTRDLVDPVAGDHPVFVIRYDGHMALASSLALRLAGIDRTTPDPPGGTIVRDETGRPTGILKMAAMDLVRRRVPPVSPEARRRAVEGALRHAAALGVTSVQDMTTEPEDVALFAELVERGEATVRIAVAPPLARWADQARVGIRRAFGGPFLRLGAVKGFVDGSLGSSTARFFEPYLHEPTSRGVFTNEFRDRAAALDRLAAADAAGLQLALHAIGDEGVATTLDLLEAVVERNGPGERRFRIEHAQHLRREDFARFARLGVIASVQPYHAIDDGRWAEDRIGPERAKTTYAFRSFLDAGVRLALGTDWNGAPLEPMWTLYAAVTRATLDGAHPEGWVPEQKITLEEAIEAYTLGSAYAEWQESEKGSIAVGKLADLVIVDPDLFGLPPERLPEARVVTTIVGGRVVFDER